MPCCFALDRTASYEAIPNILMFCSENSYFKEMKLVSCDTFVVLGNVTSTGQTIFGKNSDRPAGEVQEVVNVTGGTHAPGNNLVPGALVSSRQSFYAEPAKYLG